MKKIFVQWSAAFMVALALVSCGGNSSDTPVVADANKVIVEASAMAANDTAVNSSAPFSVVMQAGIPAVTTTGATKVNFAVFSDGVLKNDLGIANVSVAIAKLVPASLGNPDQWVNYIYRKETAAAGVGPGGVPALASAMQATTDGKLSASELLAAQLPAQLVYNAAGYYTYTFKTDIKDVSKTNGVAFEPALTHRVAVQLSYKNAAGETVLVNPYFDFTLDANGKSVAVTDAAKTRKMTDVSSCNGCHDKLALHGGGRVDTQYCVMCHNPGTFDANSGNNLNLSTMVHKIHAGKLLKSKLAAGGEDYTIWGYQNAKHSYAEVGFPQDLRNCTVCHSGANPKTPQGDNWNTKPSKEACLSCHASKQGSKWEVSHKPIAAMVVNPGAQALDLPNQQCWRCHGPGSVVSAQAVHWNQNEENAAKYRMNIESAVFNDTATHKGRTVTVKYNLSDPTNGDTAYNLVTSDCAVASSVTCGSATKFGNLRLYLGYQNMVGQPANVTELSSYNNGGNAANVYAYKGVNDGKNHYTINIPLPDDTATQVAFGTARVVSIGQVKERKLDVTGGSNPRPEMVPVSLINVIVQNTVKEFALTGILQPRRTIVSTEKCNVCHGALGTTSGSNTLADAFHGGARNTVEACVVCHDANRVSSTVMTNGMALNESYQFKRMIHGIHGNSKRTTPFTHGNTVMGLFNKDGTSATGGAPLASTVENYAAEVAWPGVGIACQACHVNNSYRNDQGTLGSVVKKPTVTVGSTTTTEADPNKWWVISPKAASCMACHDGKTKNGTAVIDHVQWAGGSSFGIKTQAEVTAAPRETCDDCHASGPKGVDLVHGQK